MEIFEVLFRFQERLGLIPESISLVDECLSFLAIIPEIGTRHQRIDFGEAFLGAGYVKETSADGLAYQRQRLIRR
jgi:hypothetical protein